MSHDPSGTFCQLPRLWLGAATFTPLQPELLPSPSHSSLVAGGIHGPSILRRALFVFHGTCRRYNRAMNLRKETFPHDATHHPDKRRRIRLRGIGAFLLALGCARSWLTLLFASPSLPLDTPIDPHHAFDILFCITSVVLALNASRIVPILEARWAKPAALATMTGGSCAAIAAFLLPRSAEVLAVASGMLGGAGFAMFLLIWAETLRMLSIARIVLYSALSQLFAVVFGLFLRGLRYDPASDRDRHSSSYLGDGA